MTMQLSTPCRERAPHLAVLSNPAPPLVSTQLAVDAKLASARREVLVLSTLSGVLADPIAMVRRTDGGNLRRGVRYRVLCPDRARTIPALAKHLSMLALAGADVRTMPDVPVDALVVDGEVAVLPNETRDSQPGGVAMFRLPSVVCTIVELFDRVWPSGVPLFGCDAADGTGLTARERELLCLLSAGHTDDSAGAQLGISVRTVRRTVSNIMNRLGARSRFQAGVKAADRGWLAERAS